YNKDQLIKAHNFPLFIAIVIIFILLISCIYLIHITRPIKRLVHRINNLSKGKYSIENVGKGIYSDVRESLNILSNRLYTNELERNKLEEMRKEWISNISHDIKTPLTSIRGNAEIMSVKDYKINDEQRIRYSNIIINKVDYIKNLVEDLNLSSHLKDKNLLLNKKEVNIISLIRHVIIDIMNDDKFNNGSINFTFYEKDIKINLDENLIKRVFINLIINAFLHNDYKVNVEVKVERINKSKVKIVIKDDGKGVSPKDLRYIFERYYRGTNTSSQIEGSGLGMAIAHDIIEAHSGAIYAESLEGNGMKITILL
ncbi:HAMP domain-containing sensor histidine kinase, partial [Clostridium sp.]